ncbi:ABC transporter ATP-binding protein [Halalkalibacter sp. APA_J-10(15)]|uniref:ABC transporter ATP-binding protein n=1 Tax=Halalkalibacter sp. APA_J-10(15) TaxID=2933805 RepID=UPI001FF5CAFC|nr:ABC transporter ATP-binding protein [Halalkalibacter sp. APA_J-10(15)]MCK0471886.1 ABC transporter ATP-binding protein [Halalkalibacter sp. APA_J-10(15)]
MFIDVKNLSKSYDNGIIKNDVLKNIDFQLEEGKICVVLGPSGSGKSTFANIIGGLDHANSGEVIVEDVNITKLNSTKLTEYRRGKVGFIFQFYNLIPNMTVYENIEIVENISETPMKIEELLELLGIADKGNSLPDQLSGGQQQRVAIGRALVKKPKLLICDEPTGALDYKSSKEILKLLTDLNNQFHTTIIMITHNLEISKLADKVIKLKDGKISEVINNRRRLSVDEVEW